MRRVAVDDGRAGEAPGKAPRLRLRPEIRHVVLLPDDRAGLDVEAEQLAVRAGGVDAIAVNGGGRTRSEGISDPAVIHLPFTGPQNLSGLLVQCERPLDAPRTFCFEVVDDEHASIRDGGPGVPAANGRAPQDLQPLFRKRVEDSGFGPDADAPLAAKLRPVFGVCHGGRHACDEGAHRNGSRCRSQNRTHRLFRRAPAEVCGTARLNDQSWRAGSIRCVTNIPPLQGSRADPSTRRAVANARFEAWMNHERSRV